MLSLLLLTSKVLFSLIFLPLSGFERSTKQIAVLAFIVRNMAYTYVAKLLFNTIYKDYLHLDSAYEFTIFSGASFL